MERIKKYVLLHLTIMLFSLTGVFSKIASQYYSKEGLTSLMLYVFLFLMLLNCFFYALAWQRIIKRFELNVAYANRNVYLIWSQVWAVVIFRENLSINNILGLMLVFVGVLVVVWNE